MFPVIAMANAVIKGATVSVETENATRIVMQSHVQIYAVTENNLLDLFI